MWAKITTPRITDGSGRPAHDAVDPETTERVAQTVKDAKKDPVCPRVNVDVSKVTNPSVVDGHKSEQVNEVIGEAGDRQ